MIALPHSLAQYLLESSLCLALLRIIKSSKRQRSGRVTLLQARDEVPASSFFSYIFWNGQALTNKSPIALL